MFRCRHCEFLERQLETARSDARQDLASQRVDHDTEVARLVSQISELNMRLDRLQLAVFQNINSPAGVAYVNRTEVAADPGSGEPPPAPEEDSGTPWMKFKRRKMEEDRVQWEHSQKEKDNLARAAHAPGAPRPENDLAAK